jgi:hypothetical protein
MPMRLPAETIRKEVAQIRSILKNIAESIEQIPGEDIPAGNDLDIQIFEFQLKGKLMLAAERLTAVVEVIE